MGFKDHRFVATNMTLKALLAFAYPSSSDYFLDEQILELPDWAKEERFDIQAIPQGEGPSVPPVAEVREMVRSLLEDRFQLSAHRETRDLPVYDLVLTRKGPTPSKDQTPPDPAHALIRVLSHVGQGDSVPRGELRMIIGQSTVISGTAISISRLVQLLQGQSDRIIVDKTGFDKLIDLNLKFTQNLTAALSTGDATAADVQSALTDESSPSIFTALQDIGLRLKPSRGPVQVLVVDSVHQPSAN